MNRLFEITYLLVENGQMTAAELAQRFEVSTRTIYRDIDTLSGAGIPVYAGKGRGGGIGLLPGFVLDRSLLSKVEQQHIMAGLHSLDAINVPDVKPALEKLAAMFGRTSISWLEVDFSQWGAPPLRSVAFNVLREAILSRRVVHFSYYSSKGERLGRLVEPLKILFKGQGWYLYGYCRHKHDFRLFKLNRIKGVVLTGETFERESPEQVPMYKESGERITMQIRLAPSVAFRVYDEFSAEQIRPQEDGSFLVTVEAVAGEWWYSFLLSFGTAAELLSPPKMREELKVRAQQLAEIYF